MSDPIDDQKKRPPPIQVPNVPLHAFGHPTQTNQQQQPSKRNASPSTHQALHSATSPLTSPLEPDVSRLPQSGSQKSRASAMTTLNSLMDQARASPYKSEKGSTKARSTTRSRHAGRSHHSTTVTQAQLEALDGDERTSRGKIESRSEKNLFKMTGQVPPTPIANSVGQNEIIIVTQDLREQCRAVSRDKKSDPQEPVKSPKKKLFGMHLPTFGRSSTPVPAMPPKAAQVLGQAPRNPTKVVVRPIKPAVPFRTPTRASRSDTAQSLPAKLLNQDTYTRSHHSGAARRNRAASRRSPPRGNKQSSDGETTAPAVGPNISFESGPPPTPPAKDTPPEGRVTVQPTSPLRRAAPSDRLREDFGVGVELGVQLSLPAFALSPSPSKVIDAENAGKSPTKYLPCTADEYQKLIKGEPLSWASFAKDKPNSEPSELQDTSTTGVHHEMLHVSQSNGWSEEMEYNRHESSLYNHDNPFARDSLQLPRPERWSEEDQYIYGSRDSRQYSPLQPRFYSPSDRSVQMFAAGETPSKNSDTSRLLCTVAPRADLLHLYEDSNNGSIEMIFQGDANDIDPQSSTAHSTKNSNQETMLVQIRDGSGLAARVMQELRIGEQQEKIPRQNGENSHLHPDQSSSRLTDMLNGVSPHRGGFDGEFQPNCPSAVPSPLHKMTSPITPMQALPIPRDLSGAFEPFRSPKTLDDHFYMTNEHLDVVGKSTWDQIETLKKEQFEAFNNKHAQLITTMEQHIDEVKMQVDSVSEKVDRTTEQGHNVQTKLDRLFEFIKDDVVDLLAAQDKKATSLEQSVKELQKMVQNMQKTLEQKLSEPRIGQQHGTAVSAPAANATTSPFPLPAHRSQPSLAGYYGNMTESGREGQPPMPHIQDHRSNGLAQDTQNDPRAGYGTNYGQHWGPRTGYPGRNGKEDRPYSGTNPYNFASNGAGAGGQFSSGYSGGYPAYNSPEPHYGFNQGQTK